MKKHFLLAVTTGCLLMLSPWVCRSDSITVTKSLNVIADTYVGSYYPEKNYGADDLDVGLHLGASGYEAISFLKFNLSTIPDNATITAATLSLYILSNSSSLSPAELYVNRWFDNTWDESTLTYNMAKANWSSSIDGGLAHPWLTGNSYVCSILFDRNHLNLIQEDLPGDRLSIIIWDQNTLDEQIKFLSKETALDDEEWVPKLTLTYEYQAVPLPGSLFLLGSGLLGLVGLRRFRRN